MTGYVACQAVLLTVVSVVLSSLLSGPALAGNGGRPGEIAVAGQGAPHGFSHDLHDFGPSYPFGRSYTRPPVVKHAPHRQAAPRWVPGHWARQWIPQYQHYDVWVPPHYGRGGWIPGHYETRAVEAGGYYQQVWVDGYWD
jgi:hypothetical protein